MADETTIQGLPPRGPSPDLGSRIGTYDYRFLVDSISEAYDLGQEALGPLICMYNTLQQTDINQRQRHRNELESSLKQAYAFIIQKHLNNQQTTYNAIRALHEHVMNTYGVIYEYEDIEAFLNDQFLQVPITYAVLAEQVGYQISAVGEYRARMRDINLPFQDISLPMNRIGWQNR